MLIKSCRTHQDTRCICYEHKGRVSLTYAHNIVFFLHYTRLRIEGFLKRYIPHCVLATCFKEPMSVAVEVTTPFMHFAEEY